ncbi:hypothetical protein DEJ49_11325 [Streptomyces venezuelae]|uniref:Uncharacterized protein n=1 Tax=Streptomyces venezuelae TaxID=54571 RepID=A0A5P2CIP2_STRVZ|nr:hypothetical protein DEJ49_11325 [Streptomyces venezuelae]
MACIEQAEDTVRELRTALARVGITVPSLRMDPSSIARETPCPRIELGGCSVDAAARLAAVLRSAP